MLSLPSTATAFFLKKSAMADSSVTVGGRPCTMTAKSFGMTDRSSTSWTVLFWYCLWAMMQRLRNKTDTTPTAKICVSSASSGPRLPGVSHHLLTKFWAMVSLLSRALRPAATSSLKATSGRPAQRSRRSVSFCWHFAVALAILLYSLCDIEGDAASTASTQTVSAKHQLRQHHWPGLGNAPARQASRSQVPHVVPYFGSWETPRGPWSPLFVPKQSHAAEVSKVQPLLQSSWCSHR
mmetsp:Transcript_131091/g.407706  ORF Transcript_131091/g.407706 Transcript_131091/m.407706 type:complete len:237 (-) Transcript_131091:425-1135(-)